ncbi:MAG: tRNA (adenosine(37)-N6)-threonylcarbamoyltransferase complex ATPase subunit type 1 TsaE [Bacteroidetes bacterium]|jgi:tRNA threonylcarbamoyladenosine biosynthesis protein TsaE|nr:tRNA (adenosine(37)-N6)-threonylcarbamoyltransferase complex ATPase subunit type 1 TsaE [Bacteroidota bacterium]GDX42682.1 tRNA (adenosine(37)-N6)-threonylcarbamoyltransferase complex ATPase subunit type 1 TsaE [Bacteroidota bacterium]
MELQFTLSTIDQAARLFFEQAGPHRVFAFHAPMGTGKTTFIAALCRAAHVKTQPSSPTFSLVNEYVTLEGESVYHIDLYRIKDHEEARNAGIEEILHSGAICFVEWPEKAPEIFPDHALHLRMEIRPVSTPAGIEDTRYLCTFTNTTHEPA